MDSVHNKKGKRLIGNSMLFALGDISSKLILFLMLPFYTNILTTDEYSISDLISTTVSLATPFFTLVIAEAVMRFTLDKDEDRNGIFSIGLYTVIIGTVLAGIISYFAFNKISFFKGHWSIFLLYFFTYNFYNLNSQFIKGQEKLKLLATAGIVNTLVLVACNILFLLKMKMGINGYLLSTVIAYIVSSAMLMIVGKSYKFIMPISKIKKTQLNRMLSYSIPMIPNSAMWWINNSSDRYIVTYMVSAAANGIYSVAYKIPSVFSVIMAVFMQAWQISVVEDFGSKESTDFFNKVYEIFLQAVILLSAAIISFSRFLGRILYAKEFFSAWTFSIILIIGYMFHSLAGYMGTVYTSVKKTKMLFYSTAIAAVVNIVLNIALVKLFSTMGAAIATLISYFIAFIIRRVDVKKYIKIKCNTLKYSIEIALLLFEAIIMLLNNSYSFILSIVFVAILCIFNYSFFKQTFEMLKSLVKKH